MKWFLAGLAFAAVVGLAVMTAAIRADNVRQRAILLRLSEQRASLVIEAAAARAELVAQSDLRLLVRRWSWMRLHMERDF